MADLKLVPVNGLRPGDKLGQDIMAGNQVLLRSGTELNGGQIQRIQRLALREVAIIAVSTPPIEEAPIVREPARIPSFRDLAAGDQPSWMADEHFSLAVSAPGQLSSSEMLFAKHKQELRDSAGLKPLIDPERETAIRKEIHAAFISSVLKKEVNLDQLDSAAQALTSELEANPGGFVAFEDIAQYGQYLAATALMSSKVFHRTQPEIPEVQAEEQIRCQLAIINAYAMLPFSVDYMCSKHENGVPRERYREALLRYYIWLRGQRFIGERTLELVMLQHERYDGQGSPYGLQANMVPMESEAWSLATAYSSRVFSRPKQPRVTGREAADQMISQSGRAFSARGVNRLLTIMGYYPTGSMVELNDGRTALVVEQSARALLKPIVRIIESNGTSGETIRLHEIPELFIHRQVLEY